MNRGLKLSHNMWTPENDQRHIYSLWVRWHQIYTISKIFSPHGLEQTQVTLLSTSPNFLISFSDPATKVFKRRSHWKDSFLPPTSTKGKCNQVIIRWSTQKKRSQKCKKDSLVPSRALAILTFSRQLSHISHLQPKNVTQESAHANRQKKNRACKR